MEKNYSDEKNVQIVVSLLKQHNIRKIIASPGATNVTLVRSLQIDPFFEMYSCVDERSAAYMACGMAAELGEPVVISCTGATASRNYMPGLTEAYYRKLPVLVITSTQAVAKVGHLIPQVIDRSVQPNDTVKISHTLPIIKDQDDIWECEIKVNNAILELKRHGGGPAHLNLTTSYTKTYTTIELPLAHKINRYTNTNNLPAIPTGKIAVFIGSHPKMTNDETVAIDNFCEKFNAIVLCDHTSNYKGKYRVLYALAASQYNLNTSILPDLLIHLGEVSGDYFSFAIKGKKVWRVNSDGELRDTYKRLENVFEMDEKAFFEAYLTSENVYKTNETSYLDSCNNILKDLNSRLPKLSLSNIWVASVLSDKLPVNSVIHFGILNSLRSWNFFEIHPSIYSYSNVGGFGIDGGVSSLIGAALSCPEKLFFGVFGDLAFFYDLNSLGNRHVSSNVRILLINNGNGTEFRLYTHLAAQFGAETDDYIAAGKHYGNKSNLLVKHFASDLGFQYFSASSKDDFLAQYPYFIQAELIDKPMVFEVFVDSKDDCDALELMMSIEQNTKSKLKDFARNILGDSTINKIRNLK